MLNILTFNCQKAHNENFPSYITSVLISNKYDFILLQESNVDVINILSPILDDNNYGMITRNSINTGDLLQFSILYKKKYKLLKEELLSFPRKKVYERVEKGSLIGIFTLPLWKRLLLRTSEVTVVCSHLHAGNQLITRKRELLFTKNYVQNLDAKQNRMVIIGGDFNTLLPREIKSHKLLMSPDFINASDVKEPTCDSEYLEPHYIPRGLKTVIKYSNIKWRSVVDHIYVDQFTYQHFKFQSKVINVRASDHKPVELKIY